MSADLPPSPPALEQRADRPSDPIAAYEAEVAALREAAPGPDYKDPHLEDAIKVEPDDVDARQVEDDVDPSTRFDDGPSEAELRSGEEDDDLTPQKGLPKEGKEDEEEAEPANPQAEPESPVVADPAESLALTLRAANPKLSLKAALDLAEKTLAAGEAVADPAPAAAPIPEVPSAEALEAERKQLDKDWRKGIRDLADDAELEKLEARIAEIDEQLPKAREADSQRTQVQATAYETNAARALELYPDAANQGSPLFKRMEEIHAALETNRDPLINDAAKALVIAQMAAKELRIAPRSGTAAPVQPNKPAAKPLAARPRSGGSAPMTAPLASASTRAASPAPNPAEKAIEDIRTPEQYEAFMRGLRRSA